MTVVSVVLILPSYDPELISLVQFKDTQFKFSFQPMIDHYSQTVLTLVSVTNLKLISEIANPLSDFSEIVTFSINSSSKEVYIVGQNIELPLN